MSPNNHSSLRRKVLHASALTVLLTVIASLSGCSTSGSGDETANPTSATASPASGTPITVVLNDTKGLDGPMTIVVSPKTVAAGRIAFTVKNAGTIKHEIFLVATNGKELIPGVDGKVSVTGTVFSILDIPAGATRGVTLDVEAGTYELLCNLKDHYANGMHVPFEVT